MTKPEPADSLLLGVDGGNTKSIALAAARDGTIVGWGRSDGSSDIHAVATDIAVSRLDAAADAALAMAKLAMAKVANQPARRGSNRPSPEAAVTAAGFSLAGADWPEDFDVLRDRLRGRWPVLAVANDAIGALRVAIPDGPGVVVVCGTGATTGARGLDGRTWHSGYWQLTQGAHELGVAGLHAIVRAELGMAPPTALTEAILDALGKPSVEAALHHITGIATRRPLAHAAFSAAVLDAAEAGDATAVAIVEDHGASLGAVALAAARRVGIDGQAFPVALAGGVLRHRGRVLRDSLTQTILDGAPDARFVTATREPAVGALLLAFDAAGIAVTGAIEDRLLATLPAPALFDTRPAGPAETAAGSAGRP